LAARITILAAAIYIISVVLLLVVMNFNFSSEAFSGTMISLGTRGVVMLRWAMIADVFGSYLLFTPLAIHLWACFNPKRPIHGSLYILCGLAYILNESKEPGFR
jgi:hypothetical protein